MKYILHRDYKGLKAKTEVESNGKLISYNNIPLCFTTSEDCHQYIARNDDEKGLERGYYTQLIQMKLANGEKHQERWDKLWENESLYKFRRIDYTDYWLWNDLFFNASIDDLKYIWSLIKDI